jgi:hypothetical protein
MPEHLIEANPLIERPVIALPLEVREDLGIPGGTRSAHPCRSRAHVLSL